MENANWSGEQEQPSPRARINAGERQSYLLLALGILIALTLPYILRPSAAISNAESSTTPARAHLHTADR